MTNVRKNSAKLTREDLNLRAPRAPNYTKVPFCVDFMGRDVYKRQELYGFAVNRNGMMCCPFHGDKHPSMKVDSRFHCSITIIVQDIDVTILTPRTTKFQERNGITTYIVLEELLIADSPSC